MKEKGEKKGRSKLLTIGAVATIAGGAIGIIIAIAAAASIKSGEPLVFPTLIFPPGLQGGLTQFTFAAVAMVSIIGGMDALKRQNFKLALAGAIYAFFCTGIPAIFGIIRHAELAGSFWTILPLFGIIGILAILCVALKHSEFRPGAVG
jgi:hypothetical protein